MTPALERANRRAGLVGRWRSWPIFSSAPFLPLPLGRDHPAVVVHFLSSIGEQDAHLPEGDVHHGGNNFQFQIASEC
jgi:hypothetical protein